MSNLEDELKDLPERKKKFVKSKYSYPFGPNIIQTQEIFADIDERLRDLEFKVNKTERKTITTRSQQILLLKHLGVLETLHSMNISQNNMAKFLSILINASEANIKDDLSNIQRKESKINSSANYKVIHAAFKNSKMKALAEETDKILDELLKSEK